MRQDDNGQVGESHAEIGVLFVEVEYEPILVRMEALNTKFLAGEVRKKASTSYSAEAHSGEIIDLG